MKKKKLKVSIIIVGCLLTLFGLYSAFWYLSVRNTYDKISIEGFEEVLPKIGYMQNGDDGYRYVVKRPGYLFYTGNLCVATEDDRHTLFIWPGVYSKTEYGIRTIDSDGHMYDVMLDKNGNPINEYEAVLIKDSRNIIGILYDIADDKWGIYDWE